MGREHGLRKTAANSTTDDSKQESTSMLKFDEQHINSTRAYLGKYPPETNREA